MGVLTRTGVAAIAVLALGLALSGCGSDAKTDATSSGSSNTNSEGTASGTSTTPTNAEGANPTIESYVKDNGITQTPVKQGDPGSPNVVLPPLDGWEDAGAQAPADAWTALVFADPAMAGDPPTIVVEMSKLTGNVDQAKVIEYAPGALKNLPGFEGLGEGPADKLSGFDTFQIGGTYVKDGAKRMIAQKTVVIPAKDGGGLFLLQLTASGSEDQMYPLMEATSQIDEKTTITPAP